MKAAIHKHSSNFNYFHNCRDESVEMVKTKCRFEQVEDRMVTPHCWFFGLFPFRIKLCSCKISGCCFCFVLTPHSWQCVNSTKIAITSPILLFPCPILPHCSLSCPAGTSWWCRGCQTWEQGTYLLPSLTVPHKFPLWHPQLCADCAYLKQTKGSRYKYR